MGNDYQHFEITVKRINENIAKEMNVPVKEVWKTLALCLWGRDHNYLPLIETMWIIGKEETLRRLNGKS